MGNVNPVGKCKLLGSLRVQSSSFTFTANLCTCIMVTSCAVLLDHSCSQTHICKITVRMAAGENGSPTLRHVMSYDQQSRKHVLNFCAAFGYISPYGGSSHRLSSVWCVSSLVKPKQHASCVLN